MVSKWIWYRGEYELFHGLKLHGRRTEFGCSVPPFWSQPSTYPCVTFTRAFKAEAEGYIKILAKGEGFVRLDGKQHAVGEDIFFSTGEHGITVTVNNPYGLPCIYAESDTLCTDRSWSVSDNTCTYISAGDNPAYTRADDDPELFPFAYKKITPVTSRNTGDGMLYDFGRETFAQLCIENAVDTEEFTVCFGESEQEALDTDFTYLFERVGGKMSYRLCSRAFRYVYIPLEIAVSFNVYAYYEYLPLEDKGSFECGDEQIDDVWKTSAYTFHLCSREFFLDGIKRDRWVWSGDAYQSYMINYYLFHDNEIARRTLTLLLGKEPYKQHVNTINDYSLYLVCGVYDYYFSSADADFLTFALPRLSALMAFIIGRLDERGYMVGRRGDWVFIDWADIDKNGANCAEQLLLYKAYLSMSKICAVCGEDGSDYEKRSSALLERITKDYWRPERGAFIDSCDSGLEKVGRHTNVLAVTTGAATPEQALSILHSVLQNPTVPPITTPYFEFYELDALCRLGHPEYAVRTLRSYWGGMLKAGATSIWEQYIPTETGIQHYAMYGMKYGKSLCHAWGAGPVYLLGRYFLGVCPTSPGGETFEVKPCSGGLGRLMGTVPLEGGYVYVEYDGARGTLKVFTDKDGGTLIIGKEKFVLKQNEDFVMENIQL